MSLHPRTNTKHASGLSRAGLGSYAHLPLYTSSQAQLMFANPDELGQPEERDLRLTAERMLGPTLAAIAANIEFNASVTKREPRSISVRVTQYLTCRVQNRHALNTCAEAVNTHQLRMTNGPDALQLRELPLAVQQTIVRQTAVQAPLHNAILAAAYVNSVQIPERILARWLAPALFQSDDTTQVEPASTRIGLVQDWLDWLDRPTTDYGRSRPDSRSLSKLIAELETFKSMLAIAKLAYSGAANKASQMPVLVTGLGSNEVEVGPIVELAKSMGLFSE